MSVFTEGLKQSLKNQRIEKLSPEDKRNYRLKTLENLFNELGEKKNRYIFYCPDIIVVNHLVKMIYDIAYALHSMNYTVVILHEIKGYKCRWLYEDENYKHYKDLKVEYVIEKKSNKSKKEKNTYGFKPTDTIIIPDVFQEILDNIYDTKLIQKVILVTGYTGIANLPPGYNYTALGVNSLIFLDEQVKKDYESVSITTDNSFILKNYFLDKNLFISKVTPKEIYPTICISKLGNEKLAQQVTNIFYNKYPNFRVFSFKIIDRNNYEVYLDSLKHSCLYLNLDETSNKQSLLEPILLGVPTATYKRKEYELNTEISDYFIVSEQDPFAIVEFLVKYCTHWLQESNNYFASEVKKISKKLKLEKEYTFEKFTTNVIDIFSQLHDERIKYFASYKQSIEKDEVNESTE